MQRLEIRVYRESDEDNVVPPPPPENERQAPRLGSPS